MTAVHTIISPTYITATVLPALIGMGLLIAFVAIMLLLAGR